MSPDGARLGNAPATWPFLLLGCCRGLETARRQIATAIARFAQEIGLYLWRHGERPPSPLRRVEAPVVDLGAHVITAAGEQHKALLDSWQAPGKKTALRVTCLSS